jgi:hypothetical protein
VERHETFVGAVDVGAALVLRPEVAEHWADESACAGMSVGALARHLVSQWYNAVLLLEAPPGDAPITALEHHARAAWVQGGPDDEANIGIREGSEDLAAEGPDAMRALVHDLSGRLPVVLAAPREGSVLIPWQGWSLTVDDFLLTRMMEIVVHSDDLAASLGLETPDFPDTVVEPVLGLLTALAVRRHGQAAVVRTLTRPQRAPGTVAAF